MRIVARSRKRSGGSGSRRVGIAFGRPIFRAVGCDLLEAADERVETEGRHLFFAIAPYEIKTFKVWFA